MDHKYVDEKVVSQVTGFALSTLRNYRFANQGPPYCKIGRAVRYRLDEVYQWMENQKVKTENFRYGRTSKVMCLSKFKTFLCPGYRRYNRAGNCIFINNRQEPERKY